MLDNVNVNVNGLADQKICFHFYIVALYLNVSLLIAIIIWYFKDIYAVLLIILYIGTICTYMYGNNILIYTRTVLQ